MTYLAAVGNNSRMKAKDHLGTLLTIPDAAKQTGIKERTLRYACEKKLMPSIMVGGSYLVLRADAMFFKKNRPKRGPKPASDKSLQRG